jgi:hypothetical protein
MDGGTYGGVLPETGAADGLPLNAVGLARKTPTFAQKARKDGAPKKGAKMAHPQDEMIGWPRSTHTS